MKPWAIQVTLVIALVLWYLMFIIRPFDFWLMMTISTMLLSLCAIYLGKPILKKQEFTWPNIMIGVLSAAVLYAIFYVGNQALILVERYLPHLLNNRGAQLMAIYANRGELAPHWNALLLFFPIGFGEELYWRGLVQKHFSTRWNRCWGFMAATIIYVAVHIPTGNLTLIIAAATCGIFWGGIYMVRGQLLPVIISHMVWDPFIFVVLPIM